MYNSIWMDPFLILGYSFILCPTHPNQSSTVWKHLIAIFQLSFSCLKEAFMMARMWEAPRHRDSRLIILVFVCSFYSLSLRKKSRYTVLILEMKAQLSLRFWWGILQLSETRILRYTCISPTFDHHFIAIFTIDFFLIHPYPPLLYFRFFWLRLPLCPQRRAAMAPTWIVYAFLAQTSCRKAQHRRSGTEWKLCVPSHTTRSELFVIVWKICKTVLHIYTWCRCWCHY